MGAGREFAMVALVGVSDATDAYFAVSSLVLWLQNWAFGALTLVLTPRLMQGADASHVERWRAYRRSALLGGAVLGALFLAFFRPIEAALLAGRHVLGWPSAALLAACAPVTLMGGVTYARVIAEERGILEAARALFVGNVAGILGLVVGGLAGLPAALLLSIVLLGSQGCTLLLLERASRNAGAGGAAKGGVQPQRLSAELAASTAENIGFNASAVAQQAIAGTLPTGAVTLNAYATRLLLIPLTGLLQPIQQRLLIRFASAERDGSHRTLHTAIGAAFGVGALAGLVAMSLLQLGRPFLTPHWSELVTAHRMPAVLMLYGLYAAVVFSNQTVARFTFGGGLGWLYATAMLVAYAAGTAARAYFAPALGIVALPACALVAEGCALAAVLTVLGARARRERVLAQARPSGATR